MPFYTYVADDGEEIEEFFNMSEIQHEIIKNGKTYKKKPEFGTAVHFKGNGWVSKGTEGIPEPKKTVADVGYKVDHDKKKEMES
jgi:hypothetical protein